MEVAIDGFLRHLKIEKNSSPLTVKSYAEDVASLLAYFQDRVG
ncbi:MAG: site-specific integrase, partial [Planctomycetota bacterium]|nr:site-specific integrase [Planctomycetota bacterium]